MHESTFTRGIQPLPKQQILDSSNLKEFEDDNFQFDENDRDLHKGKKKWEKKKLLVTSSFFFFLQCFQKTCTAEASKQGLFGKR